MILYLDCIILVTNGLHPEFLSGQEENLYNDIKDDVYDVMIAGAEKVPSGCNGVKVIPDFYEELKGKPGGQILGLTMESTRDEIFRAILEALSIQTG